MFNFAELLNFISLPGRSRAACLPGRALHGAGHRPAVRGMPLSWSRAVPLQSFPFVKAHALRIAVSVASIFLSATDTNVANQRHYVTVLAAFMYVFPLFGMFFYLCIPEPVLWDGFHSSQLDQGTIHTTSPLSSCRSLWRSRDCPLRHVSQKKTQFTCSQ